MVGALAFLLGASVGSFINVVVDRLPRGRPILVSRSRCDACGSALSPADLVPLLSYLYLRGRCRYCAAPIPLRLPLVEGGTGALFLIFFLREGLTGGALLLSLAAALLLALALIDLEHGLVPDRLVLPGAVLALLISPLWPSLGVARSLGPWEGSLGSALGSVGAGVGALLLFAAVVLLSRGGMGWGDVKLAGLVGLLTGVPGVAVALWLAVVAGGAAALPLLALRRRSRKDPIPFAPFLSAGAVAALLGGDYIVGWYLRLAGGLAL
ncbi:MAG: prepilin peptidase [Chloroflexi bacterium]|nr:prepilin peptidase [Chloroflexota bacterium]